MAMKKIYYCDICSDAIAEPSKSFGLNFSDSHHFTLGGHGCTEGRHICFECASQLYDLLSSDSIKYSLGRSDIDE